MAWLPLLLVILLSLHEWLFQPLLVISAAPVSYTHLRAHET